MVKKLSKHGNSLAIVIEKPILDLLAINEHTVLEIKTDGQNIIIQPQHDIKRTSYKDPKFQEILTELTEKYDEDLKKLADS